jgi:hypothetical protein
VFYFILGLVPLAATGISAIMIGFACINIARTRPDIAGEYSELLLKTGMETTEELLEELGLRNKAIYVPSSISGGKPKALIPLEPDKVIHLSGGKLTGMLLVGYGDNPDDKAIAVNTLGSKIIDMLETEPGQTSGDIEAAISYILTGVLDVASSVTVYITGNEVIAEIGGLRINYEENRYFRCLGSPIASIIAAISGEALRKPVRIKEESYRDEKGRIILEVLS